MTERLLPLFPLPLVLFPGVPLPLLLAAQHADVDCWPRAVFPVPASPSMTSLVFCNRFSRWSITSFELAAQSILAM